MDISVLVPGIRVHNWQRLYDSVGKSFSGSWEIIFVSPYDLPEELKKDNVVHIQDWGTPIRCQQIGLVNAKGDYITWAADDGYYLEGALDISFNLLKGKTNALVTGKYREGEDKQNQENMAIWDYYHLKFHNSTNCKYVSDHAMIVNVGLIPRQMLLDVGGWDCQFEVCPMSYSDLSVRLDRQNVEYIRQEGIMFACGHMPGHEGDHGPVHDAQTINDEPLFHKIHNDPKSLERVIIPLDNWKFSPERWERRFGEA